MSFMDRVRAFLAPPEHQSEFAAGVQGRPRNVEGEQLVVGNDLLATMIDPKVGGVYFLSIDDIIKRKGYSTYKEMIHDDQVKVCLEFKKTLVAGRTFELKPGDDSPEAEKQAKFLQEVFKRIDIEEVLHNALVAFEHGFSLAEQVFERQVWEPKDGGDSKQYVFLKAIHHRDPRDLVLKMDYHGNFIGAKQWGVAGLPSSAHGIMELDPWKLWLFTHDRRFGNLYGNSDLRAAYRAWYAKKFVIQFWNVYLERFGAPMTKVGYPLGASEQLKTNLQKILSNLASKTEILVPDDVQIELIEAKRGGNGNGYLDAVNFHNNSIARAILMPALLGADGDANRQTASTSQAFLQLRLLFKVADQVSQKLSASLMDQVIKPLLDMNFEKPIYPTWVWQDYGQYEAAQIADEIRQLHMAGILDLDQTDVNYIRSIIGLPIRDEEDDADEVIRPQATPLSGAGAAAPPPAKQGNDAANKGGGARQDPKDPSSGNAGGDNDPAP